MKIFVGCSSKKDIPNRYYDKCNSLLDKIFRDRHDLVFGACDRGLMGVAYNVAIENKCNILGIYPDAYMDCVNGLSGEYLDVPSVNVAIEKIIEESDVLLFLPGGIGTLHEIFSSIESKRAMEHNKPIIIYNVDGFYDDLFLQLDKMYKDGFTSLEDKNYYNIFNNEDEIIKYINEYNEK